VKTLIIWLRLVQVKNTHDLG